MATAVDEDTCRLMLTQLCNKLMTIKIYSILSFILAGNAIFVFE